MSEGMNQRLFQIVILFLVATTLFIITMRANDYGDWTTTFRKEARYQMATTRAELAEQKKINAELQRQIDALKAAQMGEPARE